MFGLMLGSRITNLAQNLDCLCFAFHCCVIRETDIALKFAAVELRRFLRLFLSGKTLQFIFCSFPFEVSFLFKRSLQMQIIIS